MIISGLQKFSLLDFPGSIAAIVFTQGCNFRCHYCYNPELVKISNTESLKEKGHSRMSEGDFFSFLDSRIGKLDGIVVTGGEPTIHSDLPEFLEKIRNKKLKVKLDTNGTNPEMLKMLLQRKLLDYIAMDIKGAGETYDEVVAVQPDLSQIKESIIIIKESNLPYEFRSTLVPELHNKKKIQEMGELIQGASKWYLQNLKTETNLLNEKFQNTKSFTTREMEELRQAGEGFVKKCFIR